jgi:sugar phosphate isomerase/epimerase
MNTARPISALLTSLPLDFVPALRQTAALGFTHVDVVALAERPPEHLNALAESGLLVSCAALGRDLPKGQALDAADVELRRAAVETIKRHIADAARLGATVCYLVPGHDPSREALLRFADAGVLLADYAGSYRVKLCVEHIPGRALSTAREALVWLHGVGHVNLELLIDVGHCLISGQSPAGEIDQCGPCLGYVHFDDNDGVSDLHWPLLTGRLTEQQLRAVVVSLDLVNYRGALALELNPQNADPVSALSRGKALLETLQAR